MECFDSFFVVYKILKHITNISVNPIKKLHLTYNYGLRINNGHFYNALAAIMYYNHFFNRQPLWQSVLCINEEMS